MRYRKFTGATFVLLVLCGLGSVTLRYQARSDAHLDLGETAWRLTYYVECDARRSGAELRVASPADTRCCRVFRQDFRQDNLRIAPRGRSSSQAREIVEIAEQAGGCESILQFDLRLNPRAHWSGNGERIVLAANERARHLEATDSIQVLHEQVVATLAQWRTPGLDEAALTQLAYEYCRRELVTDELEGADDAVTVLEERRGSSLGCIRVMLALCRAARIPARAVVGFIVDSPERSTASIWAEVFLENRWIPFDPVNGYARELPFNYVPARHGDVRVMATRWMRDAEIEYSLVRLPRASLGPTAAEQRLSDILDLTRLPLALQRTLSLILLMPLGAMVTCIFRNIVGLKTSGTFTPTLLALSFVFADWRTGLVIAATTIVLGLVTRYLLDALKLLMLPRLSIMLTLVVLCIVYGISTLAYLQATPGTQAILLPMVILTMLVERFYLTTQEDGVATAVQHLAGTAIVGFCCYLVLCWDAVAELLLLYPEAHFFTVALLVLIGRYTGYQLFEPFRFRHFVDVQQA